MSTLDEQKLRAEITGNLFADRLRFFVQQWGPQHPADMYEFQMALARLFVDAMRHQSMELSDQVDHMFSAQLRERSMAPLRFIHEEPKK